MFVSVIVAVVGLIVAGMFFIYLMNNNHVAHILFLLDLFLMAISEVKIESS